MTMIRDMDHVAKRAEQLEREGARELRIRAEARAVAGYEPGDSEVSDGSEIIVAGDGAAVATDGGEDENAHASELNQTLTEAESGDDLERPLLNVGDHVIDVVDEGREATMVVVGLPSIRAGAYELEDADRPLTVADVNPEKFAEDRVVECAFCNRTDTDLDETKRYAFPRGRVELETPIHDRDDVEGGGGDRDGDERVEDDNGDTVPRRSEPADFGGGESTGVQDL